MSVLAKHEKLLSAPCTEAQLMSPAFQQWIGQFGDWGIRVHRRLWEWAFIAQALYEHDMLQPGRRGLGFTAGKEPLSMLFATYGCTIVSTDLFSQHTSQHDAGAESLSELGFREAEQFPEPVSFRAIDMNALPEDLVGFDFIWSSCSLQQLGSIEHGLRFIRNAMRCLKPGGCAVHTTEFNVSSNTTTLETEDLVLYRRSDIERIAVQLRTEGHEVELSFDTGNDEADRYIDRPPYQHTVHLKLEIDEYVATSYALIIRKRPGEHTIPAGKPASRPEPGPLSALLPEVLAAPAEVSAVADAQPQARPTPAAQGMLASGPCTEAQLRSPAFQHWVVRFRERRGWLHRKLWEWCYITQALYERDMLQPGVRGLGFAVGTEPLSALFASHGCRIVATDLFAEQAQRGGWVETNQHAASLESMNKLGLCESRRFRELVSFRAVDMNAIPEDLTDFDFIWSSCSLEHLGSIERGLRFIRNSMRCLKPGGYAVHTTEINVSSNTTTLETEGLVLFRRRDLERVVAELRAAGHEVALSFDMGDGPGDRYVDRVPYRQETHLKLEIDKYVATSYGLIIRKRPAERTFAAGRPAVQTDSGALSALPEVPAAQTGVSVAADTQPAAADAPANAPANAQPEAPSAPEPPAETPAEPPAEIPAEPPAETPALAKPDTASALSPRAVAQMTDFEQIRQQTMNHTITERIIEIPWALMQLPQSGLVLDIGSCDATYLRVIHQPGRMLHCLDPRDCRGEIPNGAVFYNQSLIGNDLPGKTYDAVLLISTLEHIGLPCYGQTPFPDGDRMALAEAWRLLKPEGVLIVTVPVGQAKVATWYRQYSPAGLERLFAGWRTSISYWGFDGRHYQPITADQAARYDYRDSPYIGAGAGAIAGIVAYPK